MNYIRIKFRYKTQATGAAFFATSSSCPFFFFFFENFGNRTRILNRDPNRATLLLILVPSSGMVMVLIGGWLPLTGGAF